MDDNRIQIEEIKDRLDIVNEISKYVELKPTGKNYSGLCPFHTEKTPSFIVSPDLQRYKCFGCGESGDIFNFIQDIENIDFPEALEKLAKEAGVELKKPKINTYIARLYEINKLAGRFFYQELKKNKEASDYIKKRGLEKESIYNFGIGYASGGFEILDYLQKGNNKFNKKELLDSGLFTLKNGKLRPKFFKRIMFPIRSTSGKIIAFSGRLLPSYDKGPKYMNTPETPIYHKKENVFGQYESRQAIRKNNLVIFCEGQTDVISAHQNGIKNIVAPLGTALTTEQIKNLSKLTKNFLFIFDSDQAGQSAMEKALVLVSKLKLNAYGASPEPYKDIDDLLQDNPKKLERLVKRKTDLLSFLFTKKIEKLNLSNYEDTTEAIDWIKNILSQIPDTSIKSIYINTILSKNFFDASMLEDVKNDLTKTSTRNNKSIRKEGSSNSKISREEQFLANLLVTDQVTIDEKIKPKHFLNPDIQEIIKHIKEKGEVTKEDLLKEDFREYIEDAIFNFSQVDDKDEIGYLYKQIAKDYYSQREKELKKKIAIAETKGNSKESEKLLNEFLKLTTKKNNYEKENR